MWIYIYDVDNSYYQHVYMDLSIPIIHGLEINPRNEHHPQACNRVPSWPDSLTGGAQHRHRRGQGSNPVKPIMSRYLCFRVIEPLSVFLRFVVI